VNWKLEHGRSFFIDIVRDGIALKDTRELRFSDPRPLPPATAYEEAADHFGGWIESAADFLETADFGRGRNFTKMAAFNLHQAAETIYQGCFSS
jgi:hypothetical protein